MKPADISLRDRTIFVTRRQSVRTLRIRAHVYFGSVLGGILAHWLTRCGDEWIFPNQQARSGRWNAMNTSYGSASEEVAEACQAVGVGPFTLPMLRDFGDAQMGRLADLGDSPFTLAADGSELKPTIVPFEKFREEVIAWYSTKSSSMQRLTSRVFEVLDRMGLASSSDLGSPGFVDRFIETAAATGDGSLAGKHYVAWLRTICNRAISLGQLDTDPFKGRPGYLRGRNDAGLDPTTTIEAPRKRRRNANLLDMIAFTPSQRCPIELIGPGSPPLIRGVPQPMLTTGEYLIVSALVDSFSSGGLDLADLRKATRLEAPQKTLATMLRKTGFEVWKEVLVTAKARGGRYRIIDPSSIIV